MRFEIEFLPVMAKLNFQQPLLQFTVWYDPSIIPICHFGVQIIFLIINVVLLNILREFFSGFFDKQTFQNNILYWSNISLLPVMTDLKLLNGSVYVGMGLFGSQWDKLPEHSVIRHCIWLISQSHKAEKRQVNIWPVHFGSRVQVLVKHLLHTLIPILYVLHTLKSKHYTNSIDITFYTTKTAYSHDWSSNLKKNNNNRILLSSKSIIQNKA